MLPPKCDNEKERLETLRRLNLLDTPAERAFDDLTFLASVLCHTPLALVTLIDEHRQWFKSKVGLPEEVKETPLELSFCAYAVIKPDELLLIPDSHLDTRLKDNPAVTAGLKVRSYAGAPLTVSDGIAIGTLCVADQIPRNFSKQELLALQALARQVVAQIELRQHMAQLQEANKRALVAVQTKSNFLANMSHEIRTPMNAILGVTAMLEDSQLTSQQKERLSTIRASGEGLLTIINDILDFSKNEAGKMVFEAKDFDLHSAIQETIRIVREANKKKVDLELSISNDVPRRARGDAGRLRQVLLNLIGNALKFTEKGFVRCKVSLETSTPTIGLRFSIQDSGIGIAPEAVKGLFQPFVQADSSTHRRFGGTGLGLAISKQIVEAMGGQISVESKLGEGSTFSFTICLGPAESQAATSAQAANPAQAIPSGLKILLAEDNRSNREIALFFLGKLGCKADVVGDGKEVLTALERQEYDIVLMDCLMPEMDGFEATRALREKEKPKGKRTTVIAMTANALSEDREKCLVAGMDDYLSKPISLSALHDALARHIPPKFQKAA